MRYLFFSLLICSSALTTAQVGVNTDMPEQALDVNGKLAIGDDNEAPTEGTLRYNATDQVFEGFDGTEWTSLTNEPNLSNGGSIPAGAIPVYGSSTAYLLTTMLKI